MAYDFTLMRFPWPTQPELAGADKGPQPIRHGQIRQALASIPALRPGTDGRSWTMQIDAGPAVAVLIDPRDPAEFITVEFDRYDSQADYQAVRPLVDRLCESLRLTITDDPDVAAVPEEIEPPGLLARLRGLFGR